MVEIPASDRLRQGMTFSYLLMGLNGIVALIVVWDLALLLQGFFPIQGHYELVVESYEGRVWFAYGLTWIAVLLIVIDLLITIFRHEYFHASDISLKTIRNLTDTNLRILIYHGITAVANTGVLVGWIAYFAHGVGLFQGGITLGSITITPLEYIAYLLINGIFAIAIIIFALFLIFTRWITAKRFQQELLPRPIQPVAEPLKSGPTAMITMIDEKRVLGAEFAAKESPYVPIEERKAQKLEELRIRRETIFETEEKKLIRELEEKKRELIARQRKEEEAKLRKTRQYKKIKREIALKKGTKPPAQKPAEKEPEKLRDQFDFT